MIITDLKRFNQDKSVLIFDHIPKCAGTTMLSCMQQAFPAFLPLYSAHSWIEHRLVVDSLLEKHGVLAMAGHYAWGVHRILPEEVNCYYITILREPVSLAQSQLGFQQLKGSHACRAQIVERWLLEHDYSSMTRHLSGGPLQPALDMIDTAYAHVGFTKHFDATLEVLAEMTGIPFEQPERKNVSTIRPRASKEIEEAVRRRGGADFEVYEWAMERWGNRTSVRQSCRPANKQAKASSTPSKLFEQVVDNDAGAIRRMSSGGLMDLSDLKVFHENFAMRLNDATLVDFIDKYRDLVVNSLSADLVTSDDVVEALLNVADELSPLATQETADAFNGQLANLYLLLARAGGRKDDPTWAEKMFKLALELCPDSYRCNHAYMVWLRQAGRFREALRVVRDLMSENMGQHILREAVITIDMAEGVDAAQAFLNDYRKDINAAFNATLLRTTIPYPTVGLEAFAGGTGLLVRSGPELICKDLLQALADLNVELDVIMQESCGLDADYEFRQIFRVPDGKLIPADLVRREGDDLIGKPYDFVIVITSTIESLVCARNVLSLGRTLKWGTVWGYHFENFFYDVEEKYLFDVTEECQGAHAAG